MQSIKQILEKFNPTTDKYVSREFQTFGLYLAESLDDMKLIPHPSPVCENRYAACAVRSRTGLSRCLAGCESSVLDVKEY